jgi:hypothetical protein
VPHEGDLARAGRGPDGIDEAIELAHRFGDVAAKMACVPMSAPTMNRSASEPE